MFHNSKCLTILWSKNLKMFPCSTTPNEKKFLCVRNIWKHLAIIFKISKKIVNSNFQNIFKNGGNNHKCFWAEHSKILFKHSWAEQIVMFQTYKKEYTFLLRDKKEYT